MPAAVTLTLLCTVLASASVYFLRFAQQTADISLKVKRKTVPLYAVKSYGEWRYSSTHSKPRRFYPGTHWTGGWRGPQSRSGHFG